MEYFLVVIITQYSVAQRVERWTCDQHVVGSYPTQGKLSNSVLAKGGDAVRLGR